MEISYKSMGDRVIAFLRGELDEFTAEHVRLSLDTILSDMEAIGSATLVLDFSGVTFMDSTGIGMLLARYNKFNKSGIRIEIKNAVGHVDKILAMSGIYTLMQKSN
ncbi:MAG: STAS domain-containing protein [Clostridia bacterium]|nr:STAS domain-containing protein [Clostridia bacterium]